LDLRTYLRRSLIITSLNNRVLRNLPRYQNNKIPKKQAKPFRSPVETKGFPNQHENDMRSIGTQASKDENSGRIFIGKGVADSRVEGI